MGLFTTYNDENKVTHSGLAIRYSIEPEYKSVTLSGETYTTKYYRVSRYATKRYSYVGMDYTTARQCAEAKANQYYRNYSIIGMNEFDMQSETVKQCQADISYSHEAGKMWRCDIAVNEVDYKAAMERPASAAALFTAENNRNYDEDSGSETQNLTLTAVRRATSQYDVTTISYSQNIQNFNEDSLQLMYKINGDNRWQAAIKYANGYTGVPALTLIQCKLIYGSLESNTLEVN